MQRKRTVGMRVAGMGDMLISALLLGNYSSAEEIPSNQEPPLTVQDISSAQEKESSAEASAGEIAAADNLIQNGDFEKIKAATGNWTNQAAENWENPWIPSNIDKNNGTVSVEDGHLCIRATAVYRTAVSQTVSVDASKTYLLEYDVSTTNVTGSGVRARVRALDASGKEVNKDFIYTSFVSGTKQSHETRVLTLPQGTAQAKVELFFENSTGEAQIDNVSFKEYVEPEIPEPKEVVPEPETGRVELMSNKVYLSVRKDLRYEIENTSIARLENGMIYPLTEGETEVSIYEGTQKKSSFTLAIQQYNDTVFRQVRDNWNAISLSNQSYQPTDSNMKNLLTNLETGVASSLAKWVEPSAQQKTIFNDIDFSKSAHLTTVYRRIEQMAQVFENPYSQYYHDRELLDKIKSAMDWLYTNVYNEQKEINGNWWDYEIGTPRAIVDILIYLHPYFGQADIDKYTAPISKFVPNVSMIRSTTPNPTPAVGGNQTDLSKVAILEGALREDGQRIKDGVHGLTTIMKFVDKGEGFYEDGSFIDHTNVAYTGAYGNVLIDGFSQLLPVIQSTEFALDSQAISILYDWIDRSFAPILVKGELMDMTRGRSISRATGQSHVQAVEILRALARLAEASDDAEKMKLQSIVKGHLQSDTFYSAYLNLKSYKDVELFNHILSDETIAAPENKDYIAAFNNMDKFVYNNAQSGYTFGLSMYSSRTQNYEDMNNENRHGWYTSDGMAYLYNNDLGHYSQNYWPTVNSYRLPGTTTVNDEREDGSGEVTLKSDFVGANQLGNRLATVAMDFNNWNDSLSARKAWFIMGDKIVFLGTDIQHSSDKGAVTTIENRKLTDGQSYTYYINGQAVDLSNEVTTEKTKSFYMTNGDIKQSIGYVFLNELDTHAQTEERTGKWSDINYGQSSDTVQNHFVTLWHDQPKESSHYAYVMVPNKSMEEVEQKANTISLVHQDKDLQVIYDAEEKAWGVVKYQDGDYQLNDDLKLTKAGLYTIQKVDGGYTVSYYQPATKSKEQPIAPAHENVTMNLETAGTAAAPSSIWNVQVRKQTTPSSSDTPPNSSSQQPDSSEPDAGTTQVTPQAGTKKTKSILPRTGEERLLSLGVAGALILGCAVYLLRKKKQR